MSENATSLADSIVNITATAKAISEQFERVIPYFHKPGEAVDDFIRRTGKSDPSFDIALLRYEQTLSELLCNVRTARRAFQRRQGVLIGVAG